MSTRFAARKLPVPRCLRCNDADRVVRIIALRRATQAQAEVRGRVPGPYGFVVPIRARSVRVSPLVDGLAPPRLPRVSWGPAIGLVVFGSAALLDVLTMAISPSFGTGLGSLVMGTLAAVCYRLVVSGRRAVEASRPVVEAARRLWRACWYCERCGVVSLLSPSLSRLLPASEVADRLVDLVEKDRDLLAPPG